MPIYVIDLCKCECVVFLQPGKNKLKHLYSSVKSALASKDKDKLNSILESLDVDSLLGKDKATRRTRSLFGRKVSREYTSFPLISH